jgi:hypothetical protein
MGVTIGAPAASAQLAKAGEATTEDEPQGELELDGDGDGDADDVRS